MSALAIEPNLPLAIHRPAVADAEPFLAHRALFGLTLAPPLIALLTSQIGAEPPTVGHAAACLVSTWICTAVVGSLMHGIVNWSAPRLLTSIQLRPLAYAAIGAVAATSVVVGLMALLPRLGWFGLPVQGPLLPLILRGVGVAGLYFVAARAMALLSGRARQQTELARASDERALRARLATLQAQLNPHFLFNTLNTVASLIHSEPVQAEATIEHLAGVLQYSLTSGKKGSVVLEEELASVRDYLGIEEARFGARLRTVVDVSPELLGQVVPPMLLQPLVENAVLHGLAGRESGEIRITGRSEGKAMVLTISDDGVGPGKSTRSNGTRIGLNSVRERLEITYGAAAGFVVRARPGGGFECELRIPTA